MSIPVNINAAISISLKGRRRGDEEEDLDNDTSGCNFLQVTLLKTLTAEKYSFECGRWLDINEDDNEIVRELPATGAVIDEPLPCNDILRTHTHTQTCLVLHEHKFHVSSLTCTSTSWYKYMSSF